MNKSQFAPNLPFSLANSGIHALSCILPGLLLVKDIHWYAPLVVYLFCYIWLGCFIFDLARVGQLVGRKVKNGHLLIKFVLSLLFIFLFSTQTSWNFGLILLVFECFQWLVILNLARIGNQLLFLLTHAIYYGFVFNLILIVYDHNHFEMTLMLPLLFSFLLALCVGLSKYLLDFSNQAGRFRLVLLRIISLLAAIGVSYYANYTHHLPDWTLYCVAIGLVVTFFVSKLFSQPKKKELSMQVFILIILSLYYTFY